MLTWVEKSIQQREAVLCGASRNIWGLAEVKYQERHSAQVLKDLLQKEGFQVEQAAEELPTSFIATYGAGAPVIGLLAEYDALPGLRLLPPVRIDRPLPPPIAPRPQRLRSMRSGPGNGGA